MEAVALPLIRGRVRRSLYPNSLRGFFALMSKYSDIKKLWEREELTPQEKFEAYLEGYTMSFDFYPVCERHLFAKNDAYAIWRDFLMVSSEINRGVQELIDSPVLQGGSVGNDDITRRKIEAARRALEAIQRAHAKGE